MALSNVVCVADNDVIAHGHVVAIPAIAALGSAASCSRRCPSIITFALIRAVLIAVIAHQSPCVDRTAVLRRWLMMLRLMLWLALIAGHDTHVCVVSDGGRVRVRTWWWWCRRLKVSLVF